MAGSAQGTSFPALGNAGPSATSGQGAGSDTVLRGELVERNGRPTLIAVRRMRWGTQVLSERPLMLVEADPDSYLKASDADPRLLELAEALGDKSRLAAYVAFKQLHERKQKELLALWREGIEDSDPLAARIRQQNQRGVDAFLEDRPEFARLLYWHHFVMVASIFGRFGSCNPDGTRSVYELCSHVRHSCSPNAAWFTLRKGFPKGRRLLHIIAIDGIPRGEEITVTEENEAVLVLPKPERALKLFGGSRHKCECRRCEEGDEKQDEKIQVVLARMQFLLGVRPPTDESTKQALQCLKELDKMLPFSMQIKAKSKVLLASAFGELSQRAAWQEENKGANIIQWTGLDAEAQERRLKDTKKLYETAAKDFEYLLGQDAVGILQRLEAGYQPVHDQHKMLAKYAREKEQPSAAPLQAPPPGAGGGGGGYPGGNPGGAKAVSFALPPGAQGAAAGGGGKEGLPPGWDELFDSRRGGPGGGPAAPAQPPATATAP